MIGRAFTCVEVEKASNKPAEPKARERSMWRLGDLRSNAKGGKFLSLEPPSAYSEGQRPTVSFAADDSTRESAGRR